MPEVDPQTLLNISYESSKDLTENPKLWFWYMPWD